MNTVKRIRRQPKFFLTIGLVGLLAIFVGFSKTFIVPVSLQTFKAPPSIYIHAFFSFAWVALFTIQAFLIQIKKYKLHIKLGVLAILIALGTSITLIPVALFIIDRDLK